MKTIRSSVLILVLCATMVSLSACKSKAQREAEAAKQQADATANAQKQSAEDERKRQQDEENSRIADAKKEFEGRKNFYTATAGTYAGIFRSGDSAARVELSFVTVLPPPKEGKLKEADYNQMADQLSLNVNVKEVFVANGKVYIDHPLPTIKADLQKGTIRLEVPPQGEVLVTRTYTVYLDHIPSNPDDTNDRMNIPSRSESTAADLLRGGTTQIKYINSEIASGPGNKFMISLTRVEASATL